VFCFQIFPFFIQSAFCLLLFIYSLSNSLFLFFPTSSLSPPLIDKLTLSGEVPRLSKRETESERMRRTWIKPVTEQQGGQQMSQRERAFQSACPSNTRAKVKRFSGGNPSPWHTHMPKDTHNLIFLISRNALQPQVAQCHVRAKEKMRWWNACHGGKQWTQRTTFVLDLF